MYCLKVVLLAQKDLLQFWGLRTSSTRSSMNIILIAGPLTSQISSPSTRPDISIWQVNPPSLPHRIIYTIMDILVDGCRIAFMEELNFWDIDEMLLETCCHQVYCHLLIYVTELCFIEISDRERSPWGRIFWWTDSRSVPGPQIFGSSEEDMVHVRASCVLSRSQDCGNVFDFLHFRLHTSPHSRHLAFFPGRSPHLL